MLSKLPLVSVVIPTKNCIQFLDAAIRSVLTQDYARVECIVVDACSTDGTIQLLQSYGDAIKWISRPDRGAFDAINDGWAISRGEILCWLNSDDCLEQGAIALAAAYLRDHPDCDVFYGKCGSINEDGRLIDEFPARDWSLANALINCDHIINQAASFMRRPMLEKVGFLYPAWCHDHDLWLRIALAGGKFEATQQRLANGRARPDNLGFNPRVVIPGKLGLTRRFFKNRHLPPEVKRMEHRALSNAYLRSLFYLSPSRVANWPWGVSLAARAFLADPSNTPYLLQHLCPLVLSHTPLPSMRRRIDARLQTIRQGFARATVPLRGFFTAQGKDSLSIDCKELAAREEFEAQPAVALLLRKYERQDMTPVYGAEVRPSGGLRHRFLGHRHFQLVTSKQQWASAVEVRLDSSRQFWGEASVRVQLELRRGELGAYVTGPGYQELLSPEIALASRWRRTEVWFHIPEISLAEALVIRTRVPRAGRARIFEVSIHQEPNLRTRVMEEPGSNGRRRRLQVLRRFGVDDFLPMYGGEVKPTATTNVNGPLVSVTSSDQQWATAAEVRWEMAQFTEPVFVNLRARVHEGSFGVYIVSPGSNDLLSDEVVLSAGPKPSDTWLCVPNVADATIVIRGRESEQSRMEIADLAFYREAIAERSTGSWTNPNGQPDCDSGCVIMHTSP